MPRYTRDNLPPSRTDWDAVDALSDAELRDLANADPDNPLWTPEDFRNAEIITGGGLRRVPIYIRMYETVIEHYKSLGKGYQTRINNDLLEIVRRRQRNALRNRLQPVKGQKVVASSGHAWLSEDADLIPPLAFADVS